MVAQERTLSKQEKQSLLHKLEESYIKKPDYIVPYAVEFNLYTGMRVGELSALKWEDIDYENNLIYVRRSEKYNRSTKQYYISSTKTGKARAVPLTKESIDVLNRVKKAELKYGYLSDYVFSNKNGRIHTRLISGCARIRTTGDEFYNTKSIHAIRRTFNSELRCNGVSGTVASSIVGNTEKTNDEYYTYDVSDMQYKMAIVSKINKETATA